MSQGSQSDPSVRRSGPSILYTLVATSMVAVSTKLFSGGVAVRGDLKGFSTLDAPEGRCNPATQGKAP